MNVSSRSTRSRFALTAVAVAAVAVFGTLGIEAPALHAQADTASALNVGDTAPDFRAPGATRYGLLRDPVALSDYAGKTVVLAFFYKARTKG